MFFLQKPSFSRIAEAIENAKVEAFSYSEGGSTLNDSRPRGFIRDHNRRVIGSTGRPAFENAKQMIDEWRMFDLSWVRLFPDNAPIIAGTTVAPVIEHLGLYSINPARIVYVIDEPYRYGFAYGTLKSHAEIGEERFMIEFDPETELTTYDILAFSRPGHTLAKLGFPFVRILQKRFAADSLAAMHRAVRQFSS